MHDQANPAQRPPPLQDIARAITGLPRALATWHATSMSSPVWTLAVAAVLGVMLLPLITIAVLALTPAENIWPHLVENVLPRALKETLLLVAGVGLLTLAIGTASAWFVTMYRFPGRTIIDRLLVIPLAMPTYIVAYCYGDLLDYAGPLQSWMRATFGWATMQDYWFPDIRSIGGAVVVLSLVLYPYVYLTARASFVQQSVCALEVARTLGRTPMGAFWSVAFPLARPALAAGVALALMECLNDLGAVQFLGVETLTVSVYTTWLLRSNLGGAAQLATVMLMFVALLFAAERLARRGRFHHTTGRYRAIPFSDIQGWKGCGAAAICVLPFVLGFVVPFAVLLGPAITHAEQAATQGLWQAARNSVTLAVLAASLACVCALFIAYAQRIASNRFTRSATQFSSLGYAVPGTVLALGLLIPLAKFDNAVDSIARDVFGVSTGLLLSGTIAALVLAYSIRFLAVALGSVDAGLQRISPNLDAASRTLGQSSLTTLWRVHIPLLLPALGAGALLVFVDSMKELPATLLLRPFNFDTLATQVYNYAALEQLEMTAPGALMIVAVGLIPVLLLHKAVASGRAGSSGNG